MVFDPKDDGSIHVDGFFKGKLHDLASGASLDDVNSEYYTPTELSSTSPHGANIMDGIHINYIEESGPPARLDFFPNGMISPHQLILHRIEEDGSSSSVYKDADQSRPVFRGFSTDVIAQERKATPESFGLLAPSTSMPDLPRETKL